MKSKVPWFMEMAALINAKRLVHTSIIHVHPYTNFCGIPIFVFIRLAEQFSCYFKNAIVNIKTVLLMGKVGSSSYKFMGMLSTHVFKI